MSTPQEKAAEILRSARETRERESLEVMVRHVLGSPQMLELAGEFTARSLEAARQLPLCDNRRKLVEADALSYETSCQLENIVSLAQALRGRIRDAGSLPKSPLEQWQPKGGAQ